MLTATRTEMTQDAINELIAKRVDEALKAYDATRNPETEAKIKNEQQDDHVEGDVNNVNGNGNENGHLNVNNGGVIPSLNFKGTKGVVGLTRWFEKMEMVFHISNCPPRYQALMKLMTEVYCPRNEIQKIETELWNLKVKSNDLTDYNHRFQELTLLYTKMVLEEEDKVEKYIRGLSDNIQGNVIATKPTKLQDAIRFANNLMDQKLKGYAIKKAKNKRRFDSNSRDNHGQQQQTFRRQNVNGQNVARAYTVRNNVKTKGYAGVLPYCSKYRTHHEGPCMAKCGNCKWNECPKLRNQNRRSKTGNKTGNIKAKARAYAIGGGGGVGPDSNVVTNTNYTVELADGKFSETNVILKGCTLGLLDKYHVVIVYDERIVRIPYGDKVLIIKGDGCNSGSRSKLYIISCTKTQKYIQKGCPIYLAQVTAKRYDDEPGEKLLEDVPVVQNFLKVFPEDIPGLPPTQQEHEGYLKLILRLLKDEKLFAKFSKCEFWLSTVKFLSHMIDNEGIHVDPAKIESIKDWTSPKTPTEICQFLEATFQLLKQNLYSASILALLKGSKNFVVYYDASQKGLGVVLMQREKFIGYTSR
uniref:Reverse transcriptase domain-containing protein n=1 Tax=Tanacetum cinerariifolium TaxID=118510 RepID=A0A6L2L3E1_TANCI|nr:hypothetical protein [Tanacetum cinerariifolium]